MRVQVFLFAKEPRLGRVKSRLARDIGATRALSFYRSNLSRVIRNLKNNPRIDLTVAVSPDRVAGTHPGWAHTVKLVGQGRGDLGERMARILAGAKPGPAIIIGSDVPAITSMAIVSAAKKLGRADAVFGPSADGGYWLVGLKRLKPQSRGLFKTVRWSGPHALEDSAATLNNSDKISFAEQLDDIDDGGAYARWMTGRKND